MKHTANIVDIPVRRIYLGSFEIIDKKIADLKEEGPEDPARPYAMPGFVDAHIHIESTLMTPSQFAPMASAHGVTSVVTDPHEIANVLGVEGVEYMLRDASRVNFNFHFGASPCVPSTTFEHSGATLDSKAVEALLRRPDIYGLAEMMNVPGLVFGDPEVKAKIEAAKALGKPVDGHMAGSGREWIDICAGAGITTDHEIIDLGDAHYKLSKGIKVLIREGSAACNFDALCPLLAEDKIADKLMFCTDDKYANELREGYIDDLVRESIRRGRPLWNVLRAACINPVEHYGLADGLLREGDKADFIVVDNLRDFRVLDARVGGEKVEAASPDRENVPNNFKALPLKAEDIALKAESGRIRVIGAQDGQLWTDSLELEARVEDGFAVSDPARDIQKIIVYDRYNPGAKPAIGFVKGFSIKEGAIACSIGHDSHNIVALGSSDEEIVKVVNAIIKVRGGMAASSPDGTKTLPLPVAGLMSPEPGDEVADAYAALLEAVRATGCTMKAPLMTMAFLPLPVIPRLKITDISLFDAEKFEFCNVFV